MFDSLRKVDTEKQNCRATGFCLPQQNGTAPFEVFNPNIRAWIEERHEVVCYGVICRYVTPLEVVASSAGPTKVVQDCWTVVLQ